MVTSLHDKLADRIHKDDINLLCNLIHNENNDNMKKELYQLVTDPDDRISYNALWVFCHFNVQDNKWLYQKQKELIEMAMNVEHCGKKRLLLSILNSQPFKKDNLRTDFIDFCLTRITSYIEPYAIRVFCMRLAYKQCIYYSELLTELKSYLEMLTSEPLSPGLRSARKDIMKKIGKK